MAKSRFLILRVTEDEFLKYENETIDSRMSKSDYFRHLWKTSTLLKRHTHTVVEGVMQEIRRYYEAEVTPAGKSVPNARRRA